MTIDKKHIITRNGKEHVLYAGLLEEAHRQGLKRISTTIIQMPTEHNGFYAVMLAEVETTKGVFSDVGDASPENVGRMIIPHLLRMASTRAKARALRDAINVGTAAFEELGDTSGDESQENERDDDPYSTSIPKASPNKPASANQQATIAKLSRLLGEPDDLPDGMTSAEASERITVLSRLYNERKGVHQRSTR